MHYYLYSFISAAQSISETIEEGHAKTVKRAIEEVTIEAPAIPPPAKVLKPQPKPVPHPLPTPPNYQATTSPEPSDEIEDEVKRPPGKLKKAWPPLPSEDEEMEKVEPSVEIKSKVSSIIASFSSVVDEVPVSVTGVTVPKVPPKPKPISFPQSVPQIEPDIQLQPEPEPEYGYISPTELEKLPQQPVSLEQHIKSPEFFLAPEQPTEPVLERESSPEYFLAPEPAPQYHVIGDVDSAMEVDVQEQTNFVSLVKQEYRKAMTSGTEISTVLSPIPEVLWEPAQTPIPEAEPPHESLEIASPEPLEPPRMPTPEPPKIPTPEPAKIPAPEPPKIPTPEPPKIPTPEPPKIPTPEPPKIPTPEPPKIPTPEPPKIPTPEPPKIPTPEPPKIPTPEPPKVPTPEPPKEPTPEPPKEPTPEPPKMPTPEPPKMPTPEPPKMPTPEPPKMPTPESPKISSPEPIRMPVVEPQINAVESIPKVIVSEPLITSVTEPPVVSSVIEKYDEISPVIQSEKIDDEPSIRREVTTESIVKESSFFESKKSFSKSSFTTVETNVYTTGLSSPPLQEPAEVSTKSAVARELEPEIPVTDVTGPLVFEVQPLVATETSPAAVTAAPPISEAHLHEDVAPIAISPKPSLPEEYSQTPFLENQEQIPDYVEAEEPVPSVDTIPQQALVEKAVPPVDMTQQHVPVISPSETQVEIHKPEDVQVGQSQQYENYGSTFENQQQSSFVSSGSSVQMSSFSSTSSQMQTMFVTSSDVTTKVYAGSGLQQPVFPDTGTPSQLVSIPPKPGRQDLEPLFIPSSKLPERASTEEPVRPPKAPDRDEIREPKKPKKKRESVIQLAKRLEESIIPMSPDEVPGGIRMFPSPKQPSTPVRETPTPTRESGSAQVTSASEDEGPSGFKAEKFPELEPFPFVIQERPRRERPKSLPPPAPKKFVPGGFTDSEYESDMEVDFEKLKFKASTECKFEPLPTELTKPLIPKLQPASTAVPEPQPPKPRPLSMGQEPLLPFAFGAPPSLDGSMRPDVLKKEEEEEIKEKPKSVTPKKKSKLVEKFLASAGQTEEVVAPKIPPKKPKKPTITPPKPVTFGSEDVPVVKAPVAVSAAEQPALEPSKVETPKVGPPVSEMKKPRTEEIKVEKPPPKPMVNIDTSRLITPSKIAKLIPSPESETGPSMKHTTSKSSYSETKTQMSSSLSYQKMESTVTKTQHHASGSSVIIPEPEPFSAQAAASKSEALQTTTVVAKQEIAPEPVPVYIPQPEPPPIQMVEPEPVPIYIPEPEPAPVFVQEPEPTPVFIPEPEPTPVFVPEPEPTPVFVPEPEPTPVFIPEPEPTPVYMPEPEPSPVYVSEPEAVSNDIYGVEPGPIYVLEPEPAPEYVQLPEPMPTYIPESEPIQVPEPEPTPASVTEPEPSPICVTEPEPVLLPEPEPTYGVVQEPEPVISPSIELEPVVRHAPSPSPAPGFRSVRAPTPKRGQTPAKPTVAPPPPFDLLPPKLDIPVAPVVVKKPQPEPEVKAEPVVKPVEEPVKKVAKKPARKDGKPVKVPAGGKMLPVWPPQLQEESPKPVVCLKTRSQSAERPPVTEAPPLPERPHEAPPAVYWSSNVTIQEKRKSWPQQMPQISTLTTSSSASTKYESTSKTSIEETKKMSQYSSNLTTKKEVKTKAPPPMPKLSATPPVVSPPIAKQIASQPVVSPPVIKQVPPSVVASTMVSPPIIKQVAPSITSPSILSPSATKGVVPGLATPPVVPPPMTLPDAPDLSITSLFDLKPKPKDNIPVYLPLHKVPKIEPKKDSTVQSSAPLKEGTVTSTIIPLPPLEPFPFAVDHAKGKRPRGRTPSMPRRFVQSSFTESEYESDFESAPSPVSRLYMSDSEAAGFKPLNVRMKRGRSMQPRVPSPPAPSTFAPPKPFDEALSYANAVFPELESSNQSNVSQSKNIIQTVKLLAKQVTPETKRVTAKPLTPQAPIVPPEAIPKASPVTVQMPSQTVIQKSFATESQSSNVLVLQTVEHTEKGVKNIKKMFEGSGSAPLPQTVHVSNQPSSASSPSAVVTGTHIPTKTVPAAPETDGMEDGTNVGTLKKKPASPKSRKKTENTQITAHEREESGYVADTEGTLPRRHTKTSQSSTSSSSFSKSESCMSASYSKNESKSFSSTEFSQQSGFPSSGGMAPNGNFPPSSFTIPAASASPGGQTSHFSSSFKSTESKSSQVRKFKFP